MACGGYRVQVALLAISWVAVFRVVRDWLTRLSRYVAALGSDSAVCSEVPFRFVGGALPGDCRRDLPVVCLWRAHVLPVPLHRGSLRRLLPVRPPVSAHARPQGVVVMLTGWGPMPEPPGRGGIPGMGGTQEIQDTPKGYH